MRRQRIPPSVEIVREAARRLGLSDVPPATIRETFDARLWELSARTLALYEQFEEGQNAGAIAQRMVGDQSGRVEYAETVSQQDGFRAGVFTLLKSLYPDLRQAFLSVAQGRKSRGGKSFEQQFALLLRHAGYSFMQQHQRYRTDFVFPSEQAFDQNRVVCVVASLKRTLRERWQEVVAELTNLAAPNVYLVTADEDVSPGHVRGICDDHPLHLVVWDRVKQQYPDHPRVMGLTEFARDRLAQLEAQWQSAGLE